MKTRATTCVVAVASMILIANLFVYHQTSSWQLSLSGHAPGALLSIAGWLAVIPQVPSFVLATIAADRLHLTDLSWISLVTAISLSIYCPLALYIARRLQSKEV
jgi:uncharacterized membrane protein (UPF0136 family)